MKHPKLFFGNMVIAISMCVPLETAINNETEETNEHHQQ